MAKKPSRDVDEFMRLARERHTFALTQDAEDRKAAEEDVDFVHGNQWSEAALKKRKDNRRPILTWNRLQTFVAQVVNDGRENKPSIRVSPMDGGKPETAEVKQSRIRQIEYESDADIAYDSAREAQIVSGRGFVRISTAWKPGKTWEQTATIEPIENQFSVLFDPSARKYARQDADWCFVFSLLSQDAYERKYGKQSALKAKSYFASGENPAPEWIGIGADSQQIQVAEYWLKKYTTRELCLLEDLTAVYKDELTAAQEGQVMDERDEDVVTVCQYIINGYEILSETEFPVPYIPIVPVWGKQMTVKGRRVNYSLVRFAKDPQRLVNLYVSNIAEQIALMPKNPYVAAEGQIAGHEEEWANANEDLRAVLLYKAKDINGTPLPPPSRQASEPPIQALTIGLNQAIDAIKAAMGIFDASLGSGPGDTSGIAIQKRQKESDVANFHFADNEARSRKHVGRILLALMTQLDKDRKTVPTRSEDGKTKLVKVNTAYKDEKTGADTYHDMSDESYEPAISTGPSYNSQRQQANDAYAQIAANDKNFMTIAGDLYFRTSDMPGAEQIADRYEKMLPPQLKPAPPAGEQQAAQMQQALQQLSAQHQQLTTQVHQMAQVIEQKQIEAASRERIAAMQVWGSVRIAGIKSGDAIAIADSDREAARLEGMFDRAHEHALASLSTGADAAAQTSDQQHQQDMQQNAPPPAPPQKPQVNA